MKTLRSLTLLAAATTLALSASPLLAQQKRLSPPDVAAANINGNRVTIYYCRPFTNDPKTHQPRKIWGGLVPFGQVWRLGANEATLLVNQKPLQIGDATVPAGAHTLYFLPNEDGTAKLIINKQIGQWGTEYHEDQDLARVDAKKESSDKAADQLTLSFAKGDSKDAGVLKITWADTQYTVPLKNAKSAE